MKKDKKVAILQSNYIPWKGYFDIIGLVDEFILYDDVQYTKNDWRNRNKIMTKDGAKWLSIPVAHTGKLHQKIQEAKVIDHRWVDKHWRSLEYCYAKATFFDRYAERIRRVYEACRTEDYLSKINYRFLREICSILGIDTRLSWSSEYSLAEGKTKRLVSLVREVGGTTYLSGGAAQNYLEEALFAEAEITLEWMDYSGYPQYRQMSEAFEHDVSVLDLIFNEGPDAGKYMKCFGV